MVCWKLLLSYFCDFDAAVEVFFFLFRNWTKKNDGERCAGWLLHFWVRWFQKQKFFIYVSVSEMGEFIIYLYMGLFWVFFQDRHISEGFQLQSVPTYHILPFINETEPSQGSSILSLLLISVVGWDSSNLVVFFEWSIWIIWIWDNAVFCFTFWLPFGAGPLLQVWLRGKKRRFFSSTLREMSQL